MTEKKKALGRGLDSLFGEIEGPVPARPTFRNEASTAEEFVSPVSSPTDSASDAGRIIYIDIDEIKPNKSQPRTAFDAETIDELAASIEEHGILQPVILRKAEFGYELVAGERRWRAARKAGLTAVPALVRAINDEENALIALVENVQREDLNAVEEASAFAAIIESRGVKQEELARLIGKSRSYVTNTLRILKLPETVIALMRDGRLSAGHANALGMLTDAALQTELAERIANRGLSVREAEKLCTEAASGEPRGKRKNKDRGKHRVSLATKSAELLAVEDELTTLLGTKVVISQERRGGRIELHYYNRDGLEDLIELLRNHAR